MKITRTLTEIQSKIATSIAERDKCLEAWIKWRGMPYSWECQRADILAGWVSVLEDASYYLDETIDRELIEDDPPTYINQGQVAAWHWLCGLEYAEVTACL